MRERGQRPRSPDQTDSRGTRENELYGPDGTRYVERTDEVDGRPGYPDRSPADPDWERGYTETEDRWETPEPGRNYPTIGQVVALVVGVFFLVLGGLALARTGVQDLTAETTVAEVPHTALLGLIEIGFGALMIMAGAAGAAGRGLMAFLGALALAWGIIVVVQPTILNDLLAMEQINGWIYLAAGAIAILAGLFVPNYIGRRRVSNRYRDLP